MRYMYVHEQEKTLHVYVHVIPKLQPIIGGKIMVTYVTLNGQNQISPVQTSSNQDKELKTIEMGKVTV